MKITYAVIWTSRRILEKLFMTSKSGQLRRRCKHNVKQMQPFWDDIVEFVNKDAEENKWEKADTGFPANPEDMAGFESRFIAFLNSDEEAFEYTPYTFSEELMEFADGITGEQENAISWLFTENQPQN